MAPTSKKAGENMDITFVWPSPSTSRKNKNVVWSMSRCSGSGKICRARKFSNASSRVCNGGGVAVVIVGSTTGGWDCGGP